LFLPEKTTLFFRAMLRGVPGVKLHDSEETGSSPGTPPFLGQAMGHPEKTVSATLLWSLFLLTAAAIVWDIWVIAYRPEGHQTVSDQLEYLTYKYPLLAFIAGLLIGHVFHRSGNGH
jgi:hypothetical protein